MGSSDLVSRHGVPSQWWLLIKKRVNGGYAWIILKQNLYTVLDAYPLPRIEDMILKLAKYRVFSTFDKSAYHQLELRENDKPLTAFEAAGRLWEYNRLPFGVINGVPAFQRTMDAIVDSDSLADTYPYLDNVTVGGRTQASMTRMCNVYWMR